MQQVLKLPTLIENVSLMLAFFCLQDNLTARSTSGLISGNPSARLVLFARQLPVPLYYKLRKSPSYFQFTLGRAF